MGLSCVKLESDIALQLKWMIAWTLLVIKI